MIEQSKVSEMVQENRERIVKTEESAKVAHKRLDKYDAIIDSVHKMAANMESLITEVKNLRVDMSGGLRRQGERIGELETAVISLENLRPKVDLTYKKVNELELEPANKWKNMSWLVLTAIVLGAVGFLAGRFMGV